MNTAANNTLITLKLRSPHELALLIYDDGPEFIRMAGCEMRGDFYVDRQVIDAETGDCMSSGIHVMAANKRELRDRMHELVEQGMNEGKGLLHCSLKGLKKAAADETALSIWDGAQGDSWCDMMVPA